MQRISGIIVRCCAGLLVAGMASCVHDPFLPMEDPVDMSGDTTSNPPVDPPVNPPDSSEVMPCEPDVVYFDRQILPLLRSNCAKSGCHDAATAEDGVVLETYGQVINTADVEPFDLDGSDLWEVITETDPDKRMPPPPNTPLSTDQISLIENWILQGAVNVSCEEDTTGGCETANISFAAEVFPVIQTYCLGCHSGGTPQAGIDLSTHANIAARAQTGQLFGAINHEPGFTPMPLNGDKLDDCTLAKIKSWIDAGAPNN